MNLRSGFHESLDTVQWSTTVLTRAVQANDWLPENHLARFIVGMVEQLDLSKLMRRFSGCGSAAYPPAMMPAWLVAGLASGIFSSRKIERATYDSVAFRYIAAQQHPDHDSLANFRKTFPEELEDLFVQVPRWRRP